MGCHPSHWRTPSFFKMGKKPPTRIYGIPISVSRSHSWADLIWSKHGMTGKPETNWVFFCNVELKHWGQSNWRPIGGKMMMKHGMSAGVPECPSENRQTHMEISLGCEDECYFSWTGLMCLWPMATLPSLPPCVPELVGAAMYARPLPRPLYWWWKPGFLYMYICIYIYNYIYMYIYIYLVLNII